MEWQPIETAPAAPDWAQGEPDPIFLVWNGVEVLPASRDRVDFLDITQPDWDGEWLEVRPRPTHWMPLPAPPKA